MADTANQFIDRIFFGGDFSTRNKIQTEIIQRKLHLAVDLHSAKAFEVKPATNMRSITFLSILKSYNPQAL